MTDTHNDLEIILRRGKKIGDHGGKLVGATHEQGGIPMHIRSTGETIEVEGGEYLMNAHVVEQLGVDFFEKLNRTNNKHWDSSTGYQKGSIVVDGKTVYKDGGYIDVIPKQKGSPSAQGMQDGNTEVVWTRTPERQFIVNAPVDGVNKPPINSPRVTWNPYWERRWIGNGEEW